jgi:hypothetical protein
MLGVPCRGAHLHLKWGAFADRLAWSVSRDLKSARIAPTVSGHETS